MRRAWFFGWLFAATWFAACGSEGQATSTTSAGGGGGSVGGASEGGRRDAGGGGESGHAGGGGGASPACPSGSKLLVDRTACSKQVVAPPASLLNASASPGDVISMDGLDEGSVPCLPALVCTPDGAATLMFSDDPETPSSDGVLYADSLGPGRVRVYVYHANGGASLRKFPIVVLDQNASDAHATIRKKGLASPGTDYIGIGKTVAASWLASSSADVVTVPAGTRVLLDAALDAEHAAENELVHAIYDLDLDAKVKISIVSVGAGEDAAAITASLSLLPNDGAHDRGTFAGADVWIAADAGGEGPSARHLRLGGGVTDPELTGVDATTGAPAKLRGNYGLVARLLIRPTTAIGLLVSERGGAWGGAAIRDGQATLLPAASDALDSTTDAVWLGDASASNLDLSLLTAGGSSLPIDVLVLAH